MTAKQFEQQHHQHEYNTLDIIKNYAAKTKQEMNGVERLFDTKSKREIKLWVYADEFENQLGTVEERLHYLLIKRRWQEQYDWCDGNRSGYGKMGIAIPLVVYEYIASRKNHINEFVVCIIRDVNRWKYTDLANWYFYRITLDDMYKFEKKHYTIFVDQWSNEVIGFPFSLFKKI